VNLIPTRLRRNPRRAAQDAYFATQEDPRADTARDTLRRTANPAERRHALIVLADRELALYRLHDHAFGYTPWPGDKAGDGATGLAYGVMILRLLCAVERARTIGHDDWPAYYTPVAWGRDDLCTTERALANACAPHLARLAREDNSEEAAVLYTRLWITAYPIIGGQAAEWIAVLGNDWECRAAGVQDGPDTVLVLPDAGRYAVECMPVSPAGA